MFANRKLTIFEESLTESLLKGFVFEFIGLPYFTLEH